MRDRRSALLLRIRVILVFFVVGLVGVAPGAPPEQYAGLQHWIALVRQALHETYAKYPFMAYGTDWLAFAHILLGILFLGPVVDPVRNLWVITFGMIACVLLWPLALVCGPMRGIPFYWQLIDCAFGVFGLIPLYLARRWTLVLASLPREA